MKRIVSLILILVMSLSFYACAGKQQVEQASEPTVGPTPVPTEVPTPSPITPPVADEDANRDGLEAIGDIEVEQGLFDVTITLPLEFVDEEQTQEHFDLLAKENGWKSAMLNEDGTVTYIMTKAQHKKLMRDISDSLEQSLREMIETDIYPNFVSIEANDDYTDYTIVTKSESLDFAEAFSVLGFYYLTGMYHVFNGSTVDNIHVAFVNEASGKVFQESNSRDLSE